MWMNVFVSAVTTHNKYAICHKKAGAVFIIGWGVPGTRDIVTISH